MNVRDPEECWATLGDDAPEIKVKCQSSFQAWIRFMEHWNWTTMQIREEVYGMLRWNKDTGRFERYTVPHMWFTPLQVKDQDTRINCAACGKKIYARDGYHSALIVSRDGRPYTVCSTCYEKESMK